MAKQLSNKTAIITGGTSGIGLATAKLFAKEGARVTVTGSNETRAAQAAAELGEGVRVRVSDARNSRAVEELIAEVAEQDKGVDILFLNAGLPAIAPIASSDEATFDLMIDVNLKGPWLAIRAAIPHLRTGASIIMTTSVAHVVGAAGLSAYAAAKAGLRSLTRTAAKELLPAGIRVNSVCPGPTDTQIVEKMGLSAEQSAQVRQQLLDSVPMGRMGTADEVAQSVLFLASDASSFITGTEIVVDGGATQL
jgi:NAD(P)-dependent dehydrogenase (short-subunit alcohol dehydrogenase family)